MSEYDNASPAGVLVADPPWRFGDSLPGKKRGAVKHYPCLSIAQLCDFQLPPLRPDCYLLLWRVAAMTREADDLARAWGFVPKAEIVWLKKTVTGKRHFGMGHHVRGEHEACVIATRGRPRPLTRSLRSTFEGQVGRHSQKPDEFYTLVEVFAMGPYTELFARRPRDGWQCFGDELGA